MNILAIGAHPDDCELAIAGTLLNHVSKGDKVHILCVTDGEHLALGRTNETKKSAKAMGCSVSFLHLKDAQVSHDIKTINLIEEVIKKKTPDRIYVHSLTDLHQDHRNICKSTLVAARHIPQILFYTSAERQVGMGFFRPNYYVDITKFMDKKIDVSKLHKSINSQKDYFSEDILRGEAAFWGCRVKVQYAEVFEVYKFVQIDSREKHHI